MSRPLTAQEAASRLEISLRALRRYCATGELPSEKVGRSYLIAPADLEAFSERLQREGRHRRGPKPKK